MEILQRRIRLAERAAESEYADLSDLETDVAKKKKRKKVSLLSYGHR